jgi:hypothetical protein
MAFLGQELAQLFQCENALLIEGIMKILPLRVLDGTHFSLQDIYLLDLR